VAWLILDGAARGLRASRDLLWASLYGLTLGFPMSAVVQVIIPQRLLRRYAAGGLHGIAAAAGFGAISSSCSYGSAAATRSLYRRGADARAASSFLISSTNMNIAILVMFWTLVGWKFAFAELAGGAIIIAVVADGLGVLFPGGALERLRSGPELPGADRTAGDGGAPGGAGPDGEPVTEDLVCGIKGCPEHAVRLAGRQCWFCSAGHARQFAAEPAGDAAVPAGASAATAAGGASSRPGTGEGRPGLPAEEQDVMCGMTGSPEHTVQHQGRAYRFCSAGCAQSFSASPSRYAPAALGELGPSRSSLASLDTWQQIAARVWGDVRMLRTELPVGLSAGEVRHGADPGPRLQPGAARRRIRPAARLRSAVAARPGDRGGHLRVLDGQRAGGEVPEGGGRPAGRQHRLHLRRPADPAAGADLPPLVPSPGSPPRSSACSSPAPA